MVGIVETVVAVGAGCGSVEVLSSELGRVEAEDDEAVPVESGEWKCIMLSRP